MAAKQNDAISVLENEHETVRGLLSKLEKTTERAAKTRDELLERIDREVKIHSRIEEEIFYPAYRAAASKREQLKLYFEALEEHHVVDLVLPEIRETDPASQEYGGKAKVLKDLIEHHAEEEEEQMFKQARQILSKDELVELGEQLQARRAELEAEMNGRAGGSRGGSRQAASRAGAGRGKGAMKSSYARGDDEPRSRSTSSH